jgi:hypothetical protein
MATATTTQEIEMDLTDANITNEEFAYALEKVMNEWDRCIAVNMAKGLTKQNAVAIVGRQMTEWFDDNRSKREMAA